MYLKNIILIILFSKQRLLMCVTVKRDEIGKQNTLKIIIKPIKRLDTRPIIGTAFFHKRNDVCGAIQQCSIAPIRYASSIYKSRPKLHNPTGDWSGRRSVKY